MRSYLLFFIVFITMLIPTISIFGQIKPLPKWIIGTWHNSFESNTNKFEFWTFRKDSIFIGKGLTPWKAKGQWLNTKYAKYDKIITSTNSTCKVSFIKNNSTIIYSFKLQKVDYTEKQILTYTIIVNGIKTSDNSVSIGMVLTK